MTGQRRESPARGVGVGLASALLFAVTVPACGTSLRTVPFGPPSNAEGAPPLVPIEDAPPPAKVEAIPFDPGEPCAWQDGRWDFAGRNWEWTGGDWVVPPAGCHFAPPETVWVATTGRGQLFYMPGRWYPNASGGRCDDARSCSRRQTNSR